MATQIPRALVIDVIRTAADAIRRLGDPDAVGAELARACEAKGVDPAGFDRVIDQDPELALLKRAAIDEAVAGSTDPGPHAAISRESPSGKPGDLTKEREHPERKLHH